ncbi:uncharacterized protein LOC110467326 [Mizuhopecten yessoensis]|uniref:uncharacterized protein LOC110467326 n=1 Tax=Mizuhopecten yessoensis TaxID=6573 RepID=UPI000B458561|nr:uncharacterized protein LOC110467326 [Mizuhopecten yessoensis]XP_021380108.1 uncharacterized protein LOC110467326 [Mizuhopecten yessoensis]
MTDCQENERMSVLLSTYLERKFTGTKEEVDILRRALFLQGHLSNLDQNSVYGILCGSLGEGLCLKSSDADEMVSDRHVVVMYPNQSIPSHLANKTILYMRQADCRPGYVNLQLAHIPDECNRLLFNSFVPHQNSTFVSSDIYREQWVSYMNQHTGWKYESNGPSCTTSSHSQDSDSVRSFVCDCWPNEANEWVTRTRLYGWPQQALIDKIVDRGCHVVPVGDKCSEDPSLQWRISFATAEKSLIHSFSHIQFMVYALLKYFLKQIKETLKETIGDDDILCSYFLKTTLFHAIENSSQMFWQDKHLFYCFWFCLNILIAWVRAGFCPNYFIPTNNLFKRKVHGPSQKKLLDVLNNFYQMKWMCLSVGNFFKPTVWEDLCNTSIQAQLACPVTVQEAVLHQDTLTVCNLRSVVARITTRRIIRKALQLLSTAQSDLDEVYTYHYATMSLQRLAIQQVYPDHTVATDNKTRYRSLRKCKHWMIPSALMGTELLRLATFHFLTGNYSKSLEMCKQVMELASYYRTDTLTNKRLHPDQEAKYRLEHQQPGHASDRLPKIYTNFISFDNKDLCLPHLRPELMDEFSCILVPPLPYAVFLSFLCCNALGDTRRRDAALHHLLEVQYDEEQGGDQFYIVHTLLGICYQTLGDNHRAIRAYWESGQSETDFYEWNLAIERIAVVYLCMYVSKGSDRG